MGLDITAYSKLVKIDDIDEVEAWEEKYWSWEAYENGTLPMVLDRRTVEITDRDFPGRTEGLEPGTYRVDGERHKFRAGSYSGYNDWREQLSIAVYGVPPRAVWENPEQYEGKPFYELINFSDCEGYIGPVVARKLAQDFMEHEGLAISDHPWYREKYIDWRKAFELAADGGVVDFH